MIKVEDTLSYAGCLLACAVAGVDGKLQNDEKHQLRTIINQELILGTKSFRFAGVLNNLLEQPNRLKPDHSWAMAEIKKNEKKVSPEMKSRFIRLIQRVADAFPPVTAEENEFLQKIQTELQALGNPPPQA